MNFNEILLFKIWLNFQKIKFFESGLLATQILIEISIIIGLLSQY